MPAIENPLWYKEAVIYEVHVRAFHDSNDDGIGDFRGLIRKLDYLQQLGITAIWLLPFYPSPLRDDGYDIADYFDVHPDYGTLRDFRELLSAAHRRQMKVITELVLNHTSIEHAWFERARRSKPGSRARDLYVWSETPDKYREVRIIFKDFEPSNWSWDPIAQSYYWHRFFAHQPDLNFDNRTVQRAMLRVIDFWFKLGVDGMRLDAVPYLYEREGTNGENLPQTHEFLKSLRKHIDANFQDKMLLAEANQWPEDAAAYCGSGDECHMAFHFPLMPRIFMSLQLEDSFPISDILLTTPAIPETCQWATFLRNHDELTLEMVTDEEQDYMYRVYAADPRAKVNIGIRRRLAPLMENNRRKLELINILLFTLPGTPVIYYGDEIGMGDNYYLGDRNGVRTPMQWSPDRNAGFSRANPHRLFLPIVIDPEYHYEAINVENQERNLSSLLWWMRRTISVRKRFRAFAYGSFEIVSTDNHKVLAFTRRQGKEIVLVVVNLSRMTQTVHLSLHAYEGMVPEEVFSNNILPPITDRPYMLIFGPYFYYVLQVRARPGAAQKGRPETPRVHVRGAWEAVFDGNARELLETEVLPDYLKKCRWFSGKSRTIRSAHILENAPIGAFRLLIIQVSYAEGLTDLFLLPVAFVTEEGLQTIAPENPAAIIAHLGCDRGAGALCDAVYVEEFRRELFTAITRKRRVRATAGEFLLFAGKKFREVLGNHENPRVSRPVKSEQSNTSIVYDDAVVVKLYRRIDKGANPELEISEALTDISEFPYAPAFAGAVHYKSRSGENYTVALLQRFIVNSTDFWATTLDEIGLYFERVLSRRDGLQLPASEPLRASTPGHHAISPVLRELIGEVYLRHATLLGERTAQLHLSLGSISESEIFRPEPFTALYLRSLFQSMRSLTRRNFRLMAASLQRISEPLRSRVGALLAQESRIIEEIRTNLLQETSGMKIRIHGDYHLGQVLNTGKDFVIIDFEGEPSRALSERRIKHSPFRDVAGMIRSFHYAPHMAMLSSPSLRSEDAPVLETWTEPWAQAVGSVFLESYLEAMGASPLLPQDRDARTRLLGVFLLEKAVYEIGYELNNRPDLLSIPVRGLEYLINMSAHAGKGAVNA